MPVITRMRLTWTSKKLARSCFGLQDSRETLTGLCLVRTLGIYRSPKNSFQWNFWSTTELCRCQVDGTQSWVNGQRSSNTDIAFRGSWYHNVLLQSKQGLEKSIRVAHKGVQAVHRSLPAPSSGDKEESNSCAKRQHPNYWHSESSRAWHHTAVRLWCRWKLTAPTYRGVADEQYKIINAAAPQIKGPAEKTGGHARLEPGPRPETQTTVVTSKSSQAGVWLCTKGCN